MDDNAANNTCMICGGSGSEILEECGSGFKVIKCLSCGLVHVSPLPSRDFLEAAYSNDYYAPWMEEQRGKRILMWKKRLKTLNSFFANKGRLLDIGCGEGLFLELARKDKWNTAGTEVSPFAVRYGKERLGIDIRQGDLNVIGFPDNSFDVITMWHALEHTTNPVIVLKEVRRIK